MSQIAKTIIFSLTFLGLTIGIFPVMAAAIKPLSDCSDLGIACSGSENVGTLASALTRIVELGLSLMGIIAAIFIIYGGFRYITARGDEKEAEAAKRTVLYAVIGLVVIGLAAAIVRFVILGLSK